MVGQHKTLAALVGLAFLNGTVMAVLMVGHSQIIIFFRLFAKLFSQQSDSLMPQFMESM